MQMSGFIPDVLALSLVIVFLTGGLTLYAAFVFMGDLAIRTAQQLEPKPPHSGYFDELRKDARIAARTLAMACILIAAPFLFVLLLLAGLVAGN